MDNSSFGFVRRKIGHSTSDADEDNADTDTDTLAEEPNNKYIHYRWKSVWRQPTQDPQKKWVKETAKGQRTTLNNYASVLDALRAL